ncbi:hypothetical protein CFK38_14540 [Brachybacterium vulturis]|uniref:ESX secretion-associated protein EspG n=2 Tax=Brachybacterium vulturis TaxID=2017484 RepID=A0A291GQZ1_9MICO|nr:hypothetical protein CFK38_14540 [Brachybacterium vulturis]
MTELIATVEHAARWLDRAPASAPRWNPVYRALIGESGPATTSVPEAADLDETEVELVLRQLTSPALLVVAVTDGERTRRLRIALDPVGATVERADGDQPSHWTEIEVQEVPATIAALLEDTGIDLAPARLHLARGEDALRLTPEQHRIAHAALTRGLPAEEAFASVPDLDASLRDALTATGPRLSLALTLHDPQRRVLEEPLTWTRLWVRGHRGLYRLDQPATPALEVHPVSDGDVLGSLLPILEHGLRFAAACASSGGA